LVINFIRVIRVSIRMVQSIFYFEMHQPFLLHPDSKQTLWEEGTKERFEEVALKSHVPSLKMLTEILHNEPQFKFAIGMSGTYLRQAGNWGSGETDVMKALRELYQASQGRVEIMELPHYYSLTCLFQDPDKQEFKEQLTLHGNRIYSLFGVRPSSLANTELIYDNDIARVVAGMNYGATFCSSDISDAVSSPTGLYRAKGLPLVVIPQHRQLSTEVSIAFNPKKMDAKQYAGSISDFGKKVVFVGLDLAYIGQHIKGDKGIFEFWKALPKFLMDGGVECALPSEIAGKYQSIDLPELDVNAFEIPRSLAFLLGSKKETIQHNLFRDLESIEGKIKEDGPENKRFWRHLLSADNLFCLQERGRASRQGLIHRYVNPFDSIGKAASVFTRKIDRLQEAIDNFYIAKKAERPAIIIITPETAKLPEQMGALTRYISGKSGGLGEVVAAICKGLVKREIPVHLVTLNLSMRFREESGLDEKAYIEQVSQLNPEHIHRVSSSLFKELRGAYDGNPIYTAAEFQRQIVNMYLKEIRGKHNGKVIVHTHDWMAGGAVVAYCNLRGIPVLHTIHNTHTNDIPLGLMHGIQLDELREKMYLSPRGMDSQATAVKNASLVSYVGDTFMQEVLHDYFMEHHFIPYSVREETKIKNRFGQVLAIPNGISEDMYPEHQEANPDINSPGLAESFGPNTRGLLRAKARNLVKFQHQMGLVKDPQAILLYWPSRLDPMQKGVEHLAAVAQKIVDRNPDVQIAIVGDGIPGDSYWTDVMGRIACASNGRIAYKGFNESLSILGYAASADVFGASLYEPFGQIDICGNLYCSTATNRNTGGYAEKIVPFHARALGDSVDQGNGFLFDNYDATGLEWGLTKSINAHRALRKNLAEYETHLRRIGIEARQIFTVDGMVAGYITAYKALGNIFLT